MEFVGMGCDELQLLGVLEQQDRVSPPSITSLSVPMDALPTFTPAPSPTLQPPQEDNFDIKLKLPLFLVPVREGLCFPLSRIGCSFPSPCSVPACTAWTCLLEEAHMFLWGAHCWTLIPFESLFTIFYLLMGFFLNTICSKYPQLEKELRCTLKKKAWVI